MMTEIFHLCKLRILKFEKEGKQGKKGWWDGKNHFKSALFSSKRKKNVIEKISAFLHFSFFCTIRFDFIYLTFVWRFSHFTLNSPFSKEQYNFVAIYISFLWMIKMLTAIVFITSIHSWPRNCTLYNWTIISKVVHLTK